jgi:hypothetical protein
MYRKMSLMRIKFCILEKKIHYVFTREKNLQKIMFTKKKKSEGDMFSEKKPKPIILLNLVAAKIPSFNAIYTLRLLIPGSLSKICHPV